MKPLNRIGKFCTTIIASASIGINPIVAYAQNSFSEIEPMEYSSQELGIPVNGQYYEDFGKAQNVINWNAGDRVEDILRLKDFGTGLGNLNLDSIFESTGSYAEDYLLSDFAVLKNTKFNQLVSAVPSLKNQKLSDVEPLYDLVKKGAGNGTATSLANTAIQDVIKDSDIGKLSLNKIDLDNYSLDSIPNLINSPLNAFPNWQNQLISDIPELSNMSFNSLFSFLGVNVPVAKVDLVLGDQEGYINNTISGSYQEGFAVDCDQDNCKHIELVTYLPIFTGFDGKRWIGNSQFVIGGTGCFVGVEPTGRHPFGDNFKVVLTNVDEGEGRADFSMYFRFCFYCGCSPYFVGPIPFFSVSEKEPIFIGF